MSLDATRWAWQQQGLKSSEKLVLLSLADRAGEDMTAFPSIDRMVKDTGLNRKTIIRCFDELEAKGVLLDTGERKGKTKRVKIYQLIGVADRHDENSTKNGTIKQSQNGNRCQGKQSQNYQETVPKTVLPNSPKIGTQNLSLGNLPKEPEVTPTQKPSGRKIKPGRPANPDITFDQWIAKLQQTGEKPIPDNDKIREYSIDSGLPHEYLLLCWQEFKEKYTGHPKKYKDWRATFRNCVRGNWYKLWWHDGTDYKLTTVGMQAMTTMTNKSRRKAS